MSNTVVLFLVIAVQQSFFAVGWAMLGALRLARRPALHWAASVTVATLGLGLMLARGQVPDWAGYALANALVVAATGLARRGVRVFARLPSADGQMLCAVALGGGSTVAVMAGGLPLWTQVAAGSLAMAWMLAGAGLDTLRGLRREFGLPMVCGCAAPLLGGAAMLLARAVAVGLTQQAVVPVQVDTPANLVAGFTFLVIGLAVNGSLGALVILRLVRRLQHASDHDALTGVMNRRGFDRVLALEHERMLRRHEPYALLAVDVDHFKRYNDRHGHAAGDAALAATARTLQRSARAVDRIGRTGGEEFCLLLPNCDAAGARQVAERLLAAVARQEVAALGGGALPPVSVSVGLACCADAGTPPAALLRRADEALYAAKAGGRNRVVEYPPPAVRVSAAVAAG